MKWLILVLLVVSVSTEDTSTPLGLNDDAPTTTPLPSSTSKPTRNDLDTAASEGSSELTPGVEYASSEDDPLSDSANKDKQPNQPQFDDQPQPSQGEQPKVVLYHTDQMSGVPAPYPTMFQPFNRPQFVVPKPLYQFQTRPAPPQQPRPSSKVFDPLGAFTDEQKRTQFYQDQLYNQLTAFEHKLAGDESVVDVLNQVNTLKLVLKDRQIFNITEVMNKWKEGKLDVAESEVQEQHVPAPAQPSPPSNENKPQIVRHVYLYPTRGSFGNYQPPPQRPLPQYPLESFVYRRPHQQPQPTIQHSQMQQYEPSSVSTKKDVNKIN